MNCLSSFSSRCLAFWVFLLLRLCSIGRLVPQKYTPTSFPDLSFDLLDLQDLSPFDPIAVVLTNPLAQSQTRLITLPHMLRTDVWLTDANNQPIDIECLHEFAANDPSTATKTQAKKGKVNKQKVKDDDMFVCYFMGVVPPLGMNTYFLSVRTSAHSSPSIHQPTMHTVYYSLTPQQQQQQTQQSHSINEAISIENSLIRVLFSNSTGQVESIVNKQSGQVSQVHQQLMQYVKPIGNSYNMVCFPQLERFEVVL